MTGEGSLQYCYNAQAAASEDGVIVAAEIMTSPRDVGQLVPMVDAVKANTGHRPGGSGSPGPSSAAITG